MARIRSGELVLIVAIATATLACGRSSPSAAATPDAGTSVDVEAFAFASATHGIVSTSEGVMETEDGGHTWRPTTASGGTPAQLTAGGTLLVLGHRVFQSKAGQWRAIPLSAPEQDIALVSFLTVTDGFVWTWSAGGVAKIFVTRDAGVTWQEIADVSRTPGMHVGVASTNGPEEATFVDRTHGWLASQYPPSQPAALFATSDGGRSWSQEVLPQPPAGPPEWLSVPRFFDHLHGLVFGFRRSGMPAAGSFWTTSDGGRTWSRAQPLPAASSTASFPDRLHWYISDGASLYVSNDSGMTWRALPTVTTNYWELPIQFVDAAHGFVLASTVSPNTCPPGASCGAGPPMRRQLLSTSDGGQTWRPTPV